MSKMKKSLSLLRTGQFQALAREAISVSASLLGKMRDNISDQTVIMTNELLVLILKLC